MYIFDKYLHNRITEMKIYVKSICIRNVASFLTDQESYDGLCGYISILDKINPLQTQIHHPHLTSLERANRRTDRQTEGQTDKQTDRRTNRRTDRRIDRQTDMQADVNICKSPGY